MKGNNMIKIKAEGNQGSGKSTLLQEIQRHLTEKGIFCYIVEGDNFERLDVNSDDVLNNLGGSNE